jgi:hypothetical protein
VQPVLPYWSTGRESAQLEGMCWPTDPSVEFMEFPSPQIVKECFGNWVSFHPEMKWWEGMYSTESIRKANFNHCTHIQFMKYVL